MNKKEDIKLSALLIAASICIVSIAFISTALGF